MTLIPVKKLLYLDVWGVIKMMNLNQYLQKVDVMVLLNDEDGKSIHLF